MFLPAPCGPPLVSLSLYTLYHIGGKCQHFFWNFFGNFFLEKVLTFIFFYCIIIIVRGADAPNTAPKIFQKSLKKGLTTNSQYAIMVTERENTSKDTPRHFTGWMKRAYSWRLNTDWGGRQPHHRESKQKTGRESKLPREQKAVVR